MIDSTDSAKENNASYRQEAHFTPHHSFNEFKSLSKKYFVLIAMLVMLPVSIVASYQVVINQSSAKSSTAANITPTKIPMPTQPPAISSTPAVEILIDNSDLTGVTITGSWQALKNVSGFIGSDYLDNMGKRNGVENVKYTPVITIAGYYDVYARWVDGSNKETRVPIRIDHEYGNFIMNVNQRKKGGRWIKLGRFIFKQGGIANVTILTRGTNDKVIADGVKFKLIKEIFPTPTLTQQGLELLAGQGTLPKSCKGIGGTPVPEYTDICARYINDPRAARNRCNATYLKCINGEWVYSGSVKSCADDGCVFQECQPQLEIDDDRCGPGNGCQSGELCLSVPPIPENPDAQYACWQDLNACPLSIPTQPAGTNPTPTTIPGQNNPTPTTAVGGYDCDKYPGSSPGCIGKNYGETCPVPSKDGIPYKCIESASKACACTTNY